MVGPDVQKQDSRKSWDLGVQGFLNLVDLEQNTNAMIVNKHEFIVNFLKYLIRVLEKDLPDKGYEGELWDNALEILTKNKSHIDTAYKWPGGNK